MSRASFLGLRRLATVAIAGSPFKGVFWHIQKELQGVAEKFRADSRGQSEVRLTCSLGVGGRKFLLCRVAF